jgi:hypothetical protein
MVSRFDSNQFLFVYDQNSSEKQENTAREGVEKLNNEEFHNMYSSSSAVTLIN